MKCIEDNSSESVGLLVTYRCNISCQYCYIHTKRNLDMDLATAKSIVERHLSTGSGHVDFIFMGGETLLAMKIIRPLVEWSESKTWSRTFRFLGSTNGTLLTDDLKGWLLEHRRSLVLALSYDGLPQVQSTNRSHFFVDVDFFIKTWPHQTIQMTINEDSVSSMAMGLLYLLKKGALVHPNVAFEDTDWSDENITEYGKQLYILSLYYNKHPELPPITPLVHNLVEYADNIDVPQKQVQVCGAGDGFQVYDVDGKSYPCHILSPLVLEKNKLSQIKAGLVSQTTDFSDPRCNKCPFASSCPTCIACNFLYRGSLQKRDHTHCRIMQIEVKAFMKKEVLRLSKKSTFTPLDALEIDAIKKINTFLKHNDPSLLE